MGTKIQIRRGTASQWTAANPVLASGELALETDTRKLKAGDGATTWTGLSYVVDSGDPIARSRSIGLTVDAGTHITVGYKGHIQVPFTGTIFKWTLMANVAGSITVDVLKGSYADYPPFSGTSIVGSGMPTLSSEAKAQDDNLTTWDTTITSGDLIGFHVLSQSGLKRATLILWVYE